MRSFYIKLPVQLKNPKKEPINNKNNDEKCFLWCHIRHINPVKIHPERVKQKDIKLVSTLDYEGIKFPVSKKISKSELKKKHLHQCFLL